MFNHHQKQCTAQTKHADFPDHQRKPTERRELCVNITQFSGDIDEIGRIPMYMVESLGHL